MLFCFVYLFTESRKKKKDFIYQQTSCTARNQPSNASLSRPSSRIRNGVFCPRNSGNYQARTAKRSCALCISMTRYVLIMGRLVPLDERARDMKLMGPHVDPNRVYVWRRRRCSRMERGRGRGGGSVYAATSCRRNHLAPREETQFRTQIIHAEKARGDTSRAEI